MKNKIISILLVIGISVPIALCTYQSHHREVASHEVQMQKYVGAGLKNVQKEVLGEEPNTDFVPGYYPPEDEGVNPYPDAIVKYIEATAYCHGEVTCTGKKVREGYAAMSKRYLGMTAIVYEANENWEPLEHMGTYEIEDTGSDERIKNGNCIDIFMNSYEEAIQFGRKQVVVYLIEAKG